MKVLILAAGIGKRMGVSGKEIPKCLIKVSGKTILNWQLDNLKQSNISIDDTYIVIGSQGDCWSETNIESIKKCIPNVIINEKNVDLNQTYSFFKGINNIPEDDTLVIDGDMVTRHKPISDLISHKEHTSFITQTPENLEALGNKVILNESERIIRFTREPVKDHKFTIYAGMFIIAKKDFQRFKQEVINEEYYQSDLGLVFNKLCSESEFHQILNDSDWTNINTIDGIEEATSILVK